MIFHLIKKTKYIGRNEKNKNKLSIYLGRFAKGQKVQTKVFFNIYSNIMFVSILSCK